MSKPKRSATCHPDRKHRAFGMCNPCYAREYVRLHPRKHPRTLPDHFRRANLRIKFGLTVEDYEAMLTAQQGRCAICGIGEGSKSSRHSPKPTRLAVDHDHKTGVVRELLCGRCNRGLGFFLDNIELLDKALTYLRKWKV